MGLRELAVEDAVHSRQRPKSGQYGTHCYLTACSVALGDDTWTPGHLDTCELTTAELGVFITGHAARDELAHLAKHGVGHLVSPPSARPSSTSRATA